MRSVKELITRFLAFCPDGKWWEFLGDVARGLRVIPTRATGFAPFLLVFKQPPAVTLPAALHVWDE